MPTTRMSLRCEYLFAAKFKDADAVNVVKSFSWWKRAPNNAVFYSSKNKLCLVVVTIVEIKERATN